MIEGIKQKVNLYIDNVKISQLYWLIFFIPIIGSNVTIQIATEWKIDVIVFNETHKNQKELND